MRFTQNREGHDFSRATTVEEVALLRLRFAVRTADAWLKDKRAFDGQLISSPASSCRQ